MKLAPILLPILFTFVASSNIRSRKQSLSSSDHNHVKSTSNNQTLSTKDLETENAITDIPDSSLPSSHRQMVFQVDFADCSNNSTFTYRGISKMTCRWIRWKEVRRSNLCLNKDVRANCPQTCGLCCKDDSSYRFNFNNSFNLNCASIQQSNESFKSTCNSYSNGRMIRDGCPVACSFCKEFVALETNATPNAIGTDRSNFSVPSKVPSQSTGNPLPNQNFDLINMRIASTIVPTPPSSNIQQQISPSTHPSVKCVDNDLYQNPLGGHCGCSLFEATDCLSWKIFLTDSEIEDLLRNCPKACGSCSDVPTSVPSLSVTSPPSNELVCIDNTTYVSPVNPKFGCEIYNGTDCSIWQAFLNDAQMKDMFEQCSDSCKRCNISRVSVSPFPSVSNPPSRSTGVSSHVPSRSMNPTSSRLSTTFEPSVMTTTHFGSGFPTSQPFDKVSRPPVFEHTQSPSLVKGHIPSSWPTSQLSLSPSHTPNVAPNILPSSVNSDSPSSRPSRLILIAPSNMPTKNVSKLPTTVHSSEPSNNSRSSLPTTNPNLPPAIDTLTVPSYSPSLAPVEFETLLPSSRPSSKPMKVNTTRPSDNPSRQIESLTKTPSVVPSVDSVQIPSFYPSGNPTTGPTILASNRPSLFHSIPPSVRASSSPSVNPSGQPSFNPSQVPSKHSSLSPTLFPSLLPSSKPSLSPTSRSSSRPSSNPTIEPTSLPSSRPSMEPSTSPTIQASVSPSVIPSKQPSFNPSQVPSDRHSQSPTSPSSLLPTSKPSLSSTTRPSSVPSTIPTSGSSMSPSIVPTTIQLKEPSSSPNLLNCIDDSTYRSPINPKFGCEIYCGTNCTSWGVMLNSTELDEVFVKCPNTCNEMCRNAKTSSTPNTSPIISASPVNWPSTSHPSPSSDHPTLQSQFQSSSNRPTTENSTPSNTPNVASTVSLAPSLQGSSIPSRASEDTSQRPSSSSTSFPSKSQIQEVTFEPSASPTSLFHPVLTSKPTIKFSQQPSLSIDSSLVPTSDNKSLSPSSFHPRPSNNPSRNSLSQQPSTKDEDSSIPTNIEQPNDSFVPTLQPSSSPSAMSSNDPTTTENGTYSTHPSLVSFVPSPSFEIVPTSAPTELGPCQMPTLSRSMEIFEVLQNITNFEILSNFSTPQGKAFEWLVNEDGAYLCPDAPKLMQRYVLAVIYYSTGGDQWIQCSKSSVNCGTNAPFLNKNSFLSSENECTWAGISCSESLCVTQIEFEDNNLIGSLPDEISSLKELEFLGMEIGGLVGRIPSTISNLKKLFVIDLDFNDLTGTLPKDLFTLTNLNQLDINNNQISGTVDGIEALNKLEFLQLHHNSLIGSIPDGVSELTNLRVFTTYGNNFTSIPNLCENRDVNGGKLSTFITDCSTSCPCCSSIFCRQQGDN